MHDRLINKYAQKMQTRTKVGGVFLGVLQCGQINGDKFLDLMVSKIYIK